MFEHFVIDTIIIIIALSALGVVHGSLGGWLEKNGIWKDLAYGELTHFLALVSPAEKIFSASGTTAEKWLGKILPCHRKLVCWG